MPIGSKLCSACKKAIGARSLKCKYCGEKQEKKVKRKTRKKGAFDDHFAAVGAIVYDRPKGMPPIYQPAQWEGGPQSIECDDLYEYVRYYGLPECVFSHIPSEFIKDPAMARSWEKACKGLRECWALLIRKYENME